MYTKYLFEDNMGCMLGGSLSAAGIDWALVIIVSQLLRRLQGKSYHLITFSPTIYLHPTKFLSCLESKVI